MTPQNDHLKRPSIPDEIGARSVMPCTDCKVDDPDWICCEVCEGWFHFRCCGIPRDRIGDIVEFHCSECAPEHGPSVEKLRSKRRRVQYNYAQLDKGIIEVSGTHLHAGRFFAQWPEHPFPVVDGHSLPKLETPLVIESKDYQSLGMSIPEGINADYVAQVLGRDMPLPVIDVATQNILPGWTLGKWVDYFNNGDRKHAYNVISLEFSRTPLKDEVVRPQYVRDHDLVDKVWPSSVPNQPHVGYYCLMGVKGSFTDFHVDFGGTSVYYHIIKGAKTFLFVPPTPANLRAYEKWCKNPDQSTTWFPETLRNPNDCYCVNLKSGDTMLLPSGWIHAVYTPADSFVIGGNFLSIDFLESHLDVNSLEQRIMTPKKFTFPNFYRTLYYLREQVKQGKIELGEKTRAKLEEYLSKEEQNLDSAERSQLKSKKHQDAKPATEIKHEPQTTENIVTTANAIDTPSAGTDGRDSIPSAKVVDRPDQPHLPHADPS